MVADATTRVEVSHFSALARSAGGSSRAELQASSWSSSRPDGRHLLESDMRRWLTRRPCTALCKKVRPQPRHASVIVASSDCDPISDALDEPGQAKPSTSQCPRSPTSHAYEARSLLRGLLRQCTYLPDDLARSWVKQHVIDSFRTYKSKAKDIRSDSSLDERLRKKFKDGRRALFQLQRAAEGDSKCLQKVLMSAYGRIGKRRRELLRPLLPSPSDAEPVLALEAIASDASDRSTVALQEDYLQASQQTLHDTSTAKAGASAKGKKFEPRPLQPRLAVLLESQMRYGPPTLTRANPRRLQPDIPELNTWMRPMPQKRVKNMHKKFYAQLLDRALPPLPLNEWERLKDFASGSLEPESPKRRRRQGHLVDGNGHSRTSPLDIVVRYGKVPRPVLRSSGDGQRSARYMQRLYAKVFSQCPLMQYKEDKQKWQVTWGEQGLLGKPPGAGRS